MLSELSIKNIALIDSLEVRFEQGLNILSGETGAGKSIIIDSLSFVLGKRADKSLIRFGENAASVTAVFENLSENTVNLLQEFDIEAEEYLILKRSMSSDGKNTCTVNNQRVTLGTLKEVASSLADIYSQHENVSVLNASRHLSIIDKYGEVRIDPLKKEHGILYEKYLEVCNKLKKYGSLTDVNKNIDLLAYQIDEITQADLKDNEEDELLALRHRLNNSQTIISALNECNNLLNGDEDDNVLSAIGYVMNQLAKISSFDVNIDDILERLDSCKIELKDISSTLCSLAENNQFDVRQYEECEQRIAQIRSLKRKYGNSVEEINEYLEKITEEYEFLSDGEEKVKQYEEEKIDLTGKLYKSAQNLSNARKIEAKNLADDVLKELKELGMPSCQFHAQFAQLPEFEDFHPSIDGSDEASFMFSANAGQPPKELAKVISGGELSRFMLAMKKIIADLDGISTMVFDEIDTGISGKIAQIVAQKTYDISKNKQVLAITHMAQLASMADAHYLIEKTASDNKTYTELNKLDENDRVKEISRLIGGQEVSNFALPHAKELLEFACKYKDSL